MSSLVNVRPPGNFVNKSSILEIEYLSIGDALFTVCLKSPQMRTDVLSAFMTGTIGAAQSVGFTGVRIPWSTNLSSSASTRISWHMELIGLYKSVVILLDRQISWL